MFSSVLQDGQLVDYDVYVQSLKRDMANAIKIAQEYSGKQQQRQAKLYNRKLKGSPVEIGDRVLLANKGERGRRKLADRWEGVLYTVVGKNDTTHTFRIRNCTSAQEKVVHRNLIMPVNFLPVCPEGEDSVVGSLATEASDQSLLVEGDGGAFLALPESVPEDRTVEWVSQLPPSVLAVDASASGVVTEPMELGAHAPV
ncbi:hypothetical protein LDENG_00012470, partial [Lucifuga dentata]